MSDYLQSHRLYSTRLLLSMEYSRQDSWSGLPYPTSGDLPDPGIIPMSLMSPAWAVTQSCPTLCDPMDCSTPGFPVHHQLLEHAQTHVYRVSDVIQSSHPLLSPSPPAFNSFPSSGSFPMSQFFASGGLSIGASASVLSINPSNALAEGFFTTSGTWKVYIYMILCKIAS